jgi:PAS domain-containing protein
LGTTEREALWAGGEDSPELRWLADILDLMPVGLLLLEPETARVLRANRAADELAGGEFPRAEGAEDFSRLYRVTDRDGRPLASDEHPGVRAARGERLEGVEVDWHTPSGVRSLLVSSLSVPALLGRQPIVVISFEDATELRVREVQSERLYEDAQASQSRAVEALALLDALFLRAPVGLAFFDRSLRYVRVNEALAAMDGVPVRDHIGRTVAELLPDLAGLAAAFRRVMDTGEPIAALEYTGETPAKPGEMRHWRGSFYPVVAV